MRSRSRFLNAVRSAPPALVGVVFLLAFAYRGLLSPRWGTDTGWYASIATEVYRSGAFWTLRVGPELYFNKPPLAFWIHGAFLQLMGTGLFAMRLPSVLMAAGCVWATAAVAGRLAGPRAALWSAVALGATAEFARMTDRILLDYPLTLCMLLTVLGVVVAERRSRAAPETPAEAGSRPRTGAVSAPMLWAGVAAGLGLLTKPFLALAAFPVLALWLLLVGRGRLLAPLAGACAVAVLIAAPWHASMILRHGAAFTETYFGNQVVERAIDGLNHAEPWWWYLERLGKRYWPWLPVAAAPLVAWAAAPRAFAARYRRRMPEDPRLGLLLLGALFTLGWLAALGVFTDKRENYLLMVFPSLAWMAAAGAIAAPPRAAGRRRVRAIERALPVLAPLLLAGVLAATPLLRRTLHPGVVGWSEVEAYIARERPQRVLAIGVGYDESHLMHVRLGLFPEPAQPPLPPGVPVIVDTKYGTAPEDAEVLFETGRFVVVRTRAGD